MSRPPPSEERVAQVFRNLADSHAAERAKLSRERSWHRLQTKWQGRVRARSSGWLIPLDWRAKVGGLAVACAAVLAFSWWQEWQEQTPLTYELHGATAATGHAEGDSWLSSDGWTQEDGWLSRDGWLSSGAEPATLAFSDGSSVQLSADTHVNVRVVGDHSALARLGKGKLTARVHHADDTNWSFLAGPFEVQVVGTAFDMDWDLSQLHIVMHEGAVQVTAPGEQRWTLRRGERLTLAAPIDEPPAEVAAVEDEAPEQEEAAPEPIIPNKTAPKKARPSWSSLLSKGRFGEIVDDAKRRGIERSLGAETAPELAALAQAASYTGEAALAERTWLEIRARFAGSQSAKRGAFFLARLKEQRGQNSEAFRWLNTYLNEAPSGVYAAETQGRKLVLARRMHGATSPTARSLARAYLERFPEGAYAETARATLAHR